MTLTKFAGNGNQLETNFKSIEDYATLKEKNEKATEDPPQYDDETGELLFTTKYDAWRCTVIRMHVTDEVRRALELMPDSD